ncbi:MAG: acyl-ACP desaturase [Candidatus Saccharibacteria bacterium]|nr:acyl-ACP desaturase [Candidatus Saccharibacteria bacterium]
MTEIDPNIKLLEDLTPEVERLYDRHLESKEKKGEWHPYELVPYSHGRDYQSGDEWRPDEYDLSDGVRSALFVNLLTEDNLPYYYETIHRWSPPNREHPWSEWARQWTSEEDNHATVIREWIHVTRAIDPLKLDKARSVQIKSGEVPQPDDLTDMLVYTSLQELATRVAHSGTGRILGDEFGGFDVMSHVAGDEQLHHIFYRDLARAAFALDPSAMMIAAERQLRGFDMPGTGIPGFRDHARAIQKTGIYNFTKFKKNVVDPTFEKWHIDEIEDLSDEAKEARDKIHKRLNQLDKAAAREQRR